MNNISPKVQNQLQMLQQVQQQLQSIVQQKAQYELAIKDAKRAGEELQAAADDADVFVTVGSVMVQKDKAAVEESLSEKAETLEIRVKSLSKQEEALKGKFEQLQSQIKVALEGKAASPSEN